MFDLRVPRSMFLVTAFLAAAPGTMAAQQPLAPAKDPQRLTVRGSDILAPGGRPIRLRGFNLLWWAPPTAQDAADVQELGANCVRYMFGYQPKGRFEAEQLDYLERQIRLFTRRGLWVIPNVHTFERKEGETKKGPYDSPELQREFLDMWTHVLTRLRDEPFIAAWEPLNEPHDVKDDRLKEWHTEVVAHIRKLDPRTPIVVDANGYANPGNMADALKLDAPNVIYSFHMYAPHDYTHQKPEKPVEYPGQWGKSHLADTIAPAVRFRERHGVPVLCGEWGVITRAPGYGRWLEDVAAVLEEDALPWAHWAWVVKPHQPVNDTFDVNKQKKGIYDVMARVFRGTLAGGGTQPKTSPPPDKPTTHYEPRQLRGWTLRIQRDLLEDKNQQLLGETLKEIDNHLYRIERAVPDKAVGELRKVVLWLEHYNPKGRHAHYHPSVEWLKANGYNPDKAKGVEFGSARDFLNSVRHQPWMVLHELAHAYHDRVLGFDHPKVKEAYEVAKQSGKYDKVLIWNGHVGRHYAMTDHKEYFAENTEAFFGTNDIYPFVKAELKQHDPGMYALLAELWEVKDKLNGGK